MYLSCGFYFRQERRIACSAEKGERNGEKQQGGYELCKGKKYTVSDVSKAERHNERKNETYENINMISWNGAAEKYDIRDWAPEHEKMGKGITLSQEEAEALYELLGKTLKK